MGDPLLWPWRVQNGSSASVWALDPPVLQESLEHRTVTGPAHPRLDLDPPGVKSTVHG